jgi:HPt (histidine-containing phosphotransfer) domain-containing protein
MEVPSEVLKRYLDRRVVEISACEHALVSKEYASLLKMGHQLKGNGATFGYPALSDLGRKLENAAIASDHQTMTKTLAEISIFIKKILV